LTPIEYERLQTLPDNYTDCIRTSERYKSIGNSWSVDVIAHILSHMQIKQLEVNVENNEVPLHIQNNQFN